MYRQLVHLLGGVSADHKKSAFLQRGWRHEFSFRDVTTCSLLNRYRLQRNVLLPSSVYIFICLSISKPAITGSAGRWQKRWSPAWKWACLPCCGGVNDCYWWARQAVLLQYTDWKHQAFCTSCSERWHCAMLPGWLVASLIRHNVCACASAAFLVGIISLSKDFKHIIFKLVFNK